MRTRKLGLLVLGLTFFLGSASLVQAQDFYFDDRPREQTMAANFGLGFTLDPEAFLLAMEGDYYLRHNFTIGPLLQFGIRDDGFTFLPTVQAKIILDLPYGGFWTRVKPFGQGGLGIAYAEVDPGNADDVGFVFNLGFGANMYLTTNVALGSSILFNIFPAEVLGDRFLFTWQFARLKYHF